MDARKPHFLWNPSLAGRAWFYGVLGLLAVLSLWTMTAVFSLILLGIPAIVCAAAFYLFLYLPILDFPLIAWRRTGNALFAVPALAAALVLPFGLPMLINDEQLTRILDRPQFRFARPPPQKPLTARDILVVGEGFSRDVPACGEVCETLLWSGAADHVLAVQRMANHVHIASAGLFTAARMDICPARDGRERAPKPRDGWCIVGHAVDQPSFDAIIKIDFRSTLDESYLPFGVREWHQPKEEQFYIYDCHADCRQFAIVSSLATERLSVPLTLHVEGNIDQGGPFGLFLAREPLTIHPIGEALRLTFGLQADGFAPRSGYTGNPRRGGPLTPDPRDVLVRPPKGPDAATLYMRRVDKELAAYREKRRRLREAHPDCASLVVTPGPDPVFVRCDGATDQTFGALRRKLGD